MNEITALQGETANFQTKSNGFLVDIMLSLARDMHRYAYGPFGRCAMSETMADRWPNNHEELVALRTHLTVALLSLSLLQRRHAGSADAARLMAHTANALSRMKDELARLDTILAALEDREATRADTVRLRRRDHPGPPPDVTTP